MSYHLLAYSALIDNTPNTDLTPVPDGIIEIEDGHFTPQQDLDLIWAMFMGVTIDRARIVTPTLRQVALPYIRPISVGASLPQTRLAFADYRPQMLPFSRLEQIQIDATSSVGMGTERVSVLLALADDLRPPPPGRIYTLRGTGSTIVVANAWSPVSVTWENQLPTGTYMCIGMVHQSTTAMASRMTFFNQFYRPGNPSQQTPGGITDFRLLKGNVGSWGEFANNRFPTVEVLAQASDSTHFFYMDLVRLT